MRILKAIHRASMTVRLEAAIRTARRRGLMPLLWLVLHGNDYAVMDGRLFVIVSQPPARIIGG